MPVRALLFDLGGVVCRFLPELRLAMLPALSGLPLAQVRERIWASGLDSGFNAATTR